MTCFRNKPEIKRIAVIGAGNGGHATAADLTLAGYKVTIFEFESFKQNLDPIIRRGGVELDGASPKGFARIDKITTEMKVAVADVDLIIVVVPAYAHARVAQEIAPYLRPNKIVVLNPGHTGGSLEFYKVLRLSGVKGRIRVGETMSLTYACRLEGPARVHIGNTQQEPLVLSIPLSGDT